MLIAEALQRSILDKTYKPGEQLPSENELASQHGASRPTVRRALRELQLRGSLRLNRERERWFAPFFPIAITLIAENYRRHQREGRRGFDAQVGDQGHTPHQEIIEVSTVPAPPEVAGRLGIEEGAAVVMRRLRFLVDDQPVQLVKVYYDPRRVGGSKLEQLPSGVPVTRNIRTAYAGERPVEVLDTISNGEMVSYRFEIRV